MNKFYKIALILAVFLVIGAGMAIAENNAQEPDKQPGFVCPVLGGKAGENGKALYSKDDNPNGPIRPIADGDYTVAGPNVNVPVHATNDNGAGSPGGEHASPGDPDYTAIWNK
jgi:hypothetical protein